MGLNFLMHEDLQEQWLCSFCEAAQKGADEGTAKAIAWAKVRCQRQGNPAVASPGRAKKSGGKKRRHGIGVVPPPKKGRPSTWKMTPTGRFRARLGSLPDKWKREWVRRYKAALKKQEMRTDLKEHQQKTIAAKQAWDAIKKQGCRISTAARPARGKAVYVAPNKRARDRDEFSGWICPEWEETEAARKKMESEVIRESERIEKRERVKQKKEQAAYKKGEKRAASKRRAVERAAKAAEKARRKTQTPHEYGEEFKERYGAHGLLPERPRKPKPPTSAQIRQKRKAVRPREYDSRWKYKTGEVIFHPDFGYGQVVDTKSGKMTVRFEGRGKDRKVKRDLKMGEK